MSHACRLLVVALLSVALAVPATAAAWPAGDGAIATLSAAKKKKKCKVKRVNGKRKKVCKKKAGTRRTARPGGPTPQTTGGGVTPPPSPAPAPPPPPAPPAPAPDPTPPPPAPVDPEQYRADDLGRQVMSSGNIYLERFSGSGFAAEYKRIYLRQGGALKVAVSDYNIEMGEKCRSVTQGTWAFNRAYKPPEGGLLVVLDITTNGDTGTDVFWFFNDMTVRVGKDQEQYQINDNMGEPC